MAKQKKHQQNVEILHHLSKNYYFVFVLSPLILINYYSLDVNMLKVELKLITEKAFSTIKLAVAQDSSLLWKQIRP